MFGRIGPITVLFCLCGGLWAQDLGGPVSKPPGAGQDYLYPVGGRLETFLAPSLMPTPIDEGKVVQYVSFNGTVHVLTEFKGKNVSLLLPDSWITGLTLQERRTLLDRSDLLYELFRDLVGRDPSGAGLLPIAFVTNTCGWGCAWIGAKGVEILDADWSLADAKNALGFGHIPGVVSHEMSHNFDVYASYLHYLQHHAHAWTAFLDSYIQIYSQQGYLITSPKQLLADRIRATWIPYVANPNATWQNSVRNGDPTIEMTHLIWGGLHLRFAELHGAEAVRRMMRFLQTYAYTHSPPSSPEAKEDLNIEALAAGAQLNLSCYVDAWRWYASPQLRTTMAAAYGNENSFCQDHQVVGELDDREATVKNPVIDELGDFPGHPFPFAVPLPVHINAGGSNQDSDYFEFTLNTAAAVKFVVRSSAEFEGVLFLHAADRQSPWIRVVGIQKGQTTTTTWNYTAAGAWTFEIYRPSTTPSSAAYSVDIFPVEPWPMVWGTVSQPDKVSEGYRLSAKTTSLAGVAEPPTHVRFWVSGFGFVGTTPFAADVSFDWSPPGNLQAGTYGYRAQLFSGDIPVTPDTAAELFVVSTNRLPVSVPGKSQSVECTNSRGTRVMLDGSDSYDPDSDPLTFEWVTDEGATVGTTATLTIDLPAGLHRFTLIVSDGHPGGTSSASISINVVDTTAPQLDVTITPDLLWPPNNKLVDVRATIEARDRCDGNPRVRLVSITSSENSEVYVEDANFGEDDRSFSLRAAREGSGSGRVYTITYQTRDQSGNETNKSAIVTVPHDHR